MVSYDQELQPGVGFISWVGNGVCPPRNSGSEKVITRFVNDGDFEKFLNGGLAEKDIRITHTIEFPQSFLRRAKALYDVQSKPNNDVMDNLINQFFDSRKKPVQPATNNNPNH